MAIFDKTTKKNKLISSEQERLVKSTASCISQLIKTLDEAAHLGALVQEDILTGGGLFDMEDVSQMKEEFATQASLIGLIASKVTAMGAVEDADPVVFASNLEAHKTNYPLDLAAYKTRFEV